MKVGLFLTAIFLISVLSIQGICEEAGDAATTPNISERNNIWAQTTPQTQIVLGIGDLIFLGSSHLLEDKEFREASRKYNFLHKREVSARAEYDGFYLNISKEESSLQELQANRGGIETELKLQMNLIKSKESSLEKARAVLTSGDKESQITSIKVRLMELHTQAIRDHHGKLTDPEDLYSSLSSTEAAEMRSLQTQYNAIRDMPDLNREEKKGLIKQAETELDASHRSRNETLKSMQSVQQRIAEKSAEIERLRPQLAKYESAWKVEEQSASLAKSEVSLVAKQRGARRLGYKAVRVGGNIIFGLDLGARIVYYFVAQQDPGWFPFGKILQRIL